MGRSQAKAQRHNGGYQSHNDTHYPPNRTQSPQIYNMAEPGGSTGFWGSSLFDALRPTGCQPAQMDIHHLSEMAALNGGHIAIATFAHLLNRIDQVSSWPATGKKPLAAE